MTTLELLDETARHGLTLRPAGCDRLAVIPARLCPPDFADALRRHKPELLALLRSRFLVVESAALNETIFFAADEQTRNALVDAGADASCIYMREELRTLVEHHRKSPFSADELLRLHAAKRMFNGRIAE